MTTRAARRLGGTTKFGPWTTSREPTNHSIGWEVGPDPARPERTGRHGAPGGPYARGHELGQPAPSPPGDRERGHLQVGLPAERFQDLLGDHTDAGPRAVQ